MLRCLGLLLLAPFTAALQPRDFRVPPVDFTQLSSAANNAHNFDLLARLQENGIIALQNVPKFSNLRSEYLRTAADCAVQAQRQGAEFLLHRQLRDGTNRYTVSLESGRRLSETLDQSAQLLAICPEYVEVHAAFSAVVELAVANVGTALDATQNFHVVAEQGAVAMTARQLLEESVHLDHFHAYEAARKLKNGYISDAEVNVADMSLELHTDNGLIIAMTAPEYFEVLPTGELQLKQTQGQDAGLFIQVANGEIVRPVLNPDELILMLGSGIDDWIKTSPPLHSVLHGMRYPRTVSAVNEDGQGNTLLRSWFGKMILLEEHQVMDNTGLTFGQYVNQTTRYLTQQEGEDHQAFGTVACPPQRRLAASDNSCSLKMCSLKSTAKASDLTYSCQITCNHDSTSDAALCEKYCDCEDSTNGGTTCWMLCVENFSSDVCPGEQECNNASTEDKLAMTCVGGTVAPSTSTSSATSSTAASNSGNTTATTTPSTSTTAPSSTTGSAMASANVGDESTAASTALGTASGSTAASAANLISSASASASASSDTSSPSSAASVVPFAIFVNGVALLVAVFLCIQLTKRARR
ncbi:hypothetical protein PF005_g19607 [Phytophthora fragariae]|uniref:Isopenicillin N synthase-like Fe(2+) 2OG dioxygenase domain-containing protein n=1 Tax=Phytophthora fragariae TaxID=53985 RepID=A0A6A3WR29_9STRA|nr:hypothetical protein PF009_g20558 [Phytophthora fragariae]KAE8979752.1 hypothetical protein PF011_g22716 [Phytophthora fragariae]KAE9077515.1 hypothetical protein PF010_g23480 [Phytophthora fragariae]KAE9079491.1 hypothetical protein PF007_g23422 [Phytophthora fragariae]KAE9101310.1 hypothetical protein PF006_g22699 [Phytophthora fragariae]